MRGVNLGGWFSQVDALREKDPEGFVDLRTHVETFLGGKDFARVAAWGFDHVRLPLDYFNLFEEPSMEPDEPIVELLDRALDGLSAVGLSVILDLHKCPGHDFHAGANCAQEFFTSPKKREEAKCVWKYLAERYGTRSNVLLEILNEPVAEDSRLWDEVKVEMAENIRRYAPDSTLVVGSNRWNNPREFSKLTPLSDDNVLYSFHFYSPVLFTHQNAPWIAGEVFRQKRSYPGNYTISANTKHRLPLEPGVWDKTRMQGELEQVIRFREKYRVAVACNEFGVYAGGADRESQLCWMQDFVSLLQEQGIGYSYWNYKNLDFGLVSQGEKLFAEYPQYLNPSRVDGDLLEILRQRRTLSGLRPACLETTASAAVPTLRSSELTRH